MKLKLFVWHGVLIDNTAGMMFAVAPTVERARELLLEKCDYIPLEDLMKEPEVVEGEYADSIWGGD